MPTIPDAKNQWYVVHVLSGQENRVHQRLERMVEAEEMGDKVFKVLMPTEIVSEVKRGKKSEMKKKFYPGYVIINMDLLAADNRLNEDVWYFIKEIDGVIGFAGTKDKPIPMRPREVDAMLSQIKEREESVRPSVSFNVGDTVKVVDGPFESQNGVVEELDPEKGTLRVAVSMFGRDTPVDLEFWQVEEAEE